jgi:hypothetical protein
MDVTTGEREQQRKRGTGRRAVCRLPDPLPVDIAAHYGFWHLGRFAHYYRETFGCAPSVTLRRVWSESTRSAAR